MICAKINTTQWQYPGLAPSVNHSISYFLCFKMLSLRFGTLINESILKEHIARFCINFLLKITKMKKNILATG